MVDWPVYFTLACRLHGIISQKEGCPHLFCNNKCDDDDGVQQLNTYYTQSNKILTNILKYVEWMGMQSTKCDWHCQQILKCRGLIWHGIDILANSDSGPLSTSSLLDGLRRLLRLRRRRRR